MNGAHVGVSFVTNINCFEDNDFGKEKGKGKTFIQMKCKIHTMYENYSMVMYPLNA
jgi:hypothetical protein